MHRESFPVNNVFCAQPRKFSRSKVLLYTVIMEVDKGAAVSVMSRSLSFQELPYRRLRLDCILKWPKRCQISVDVKYGSYRGKHTLYAVKENNPCLLGRNWLEQIQLDWASIKAMYVNETTSKTEALVQKYPEVFKSGLGTMKAFKAH